MEQLAKYMIFTYPFASIEQKPLTQRRMTQIINELDLLGLVSTDIINQGRYGRSQKIKVMIPLTTVEEALKDDISLASLID